MSSAKESQPSSSKQSSSETDNASPFELNSRRMATKRMLLKKALNSVNFDSIKSNSKERLTLIQEDVKERFACYMEATGLLYDAINNSESLGEDVVVEEIDALAKSMYQHCSAILLSLIRSKESEHKLSSSSSQKPLTVAYQPLLKLPGLKIPIFSDNDSDPFVFTKFESSFNNAVLSQEGIKPPILLMYLKSYLRLRAFSLKENFPNDEDGFGKAMMLLRDAFFNKDELVEKTLEFVNMQKRSLLLTTT